MAEARTGEEGAAAERQVTNAPRAGRHRGAAAGGKGRTRKRKKKKEKGTRRSGGGHFHRPTTPPCPAADRGARPAALRRRGAAQSPGCPVRLRRPLAAVRLPHLSGCSAPCPKSPASLASGCRRITPREVSPFAGQFGRLGFFLGFGDFMTFFSSSFLFIFFPLALLRLEPAEFDAGECLSAEGILRQQDEVVPGDDTHCVDLRADI